MSYYVPIVYAYGRRALDSILQGELANEVAQALEAERVTYAITVTRTTIEGGDPYDPGSGTEVQTPYPCKGWRDDYDQDNVDGTLILSSDVRIFIVVGSLAITPATSDTITVNGKTYSIVNIGIDPASALYDVQARA